MTIKELCKNCGHIKENHTDRETGEVEGCLHEIESNSEDTMFGDQCNCEHFKGS